jgi:hypothetical protein
MLDGFWLLEIADDRGMAARGIVVLRGSAVHGIGDLASLSGEVECHEDSVIGMLDLVLRATDPRGGTREERVRLQIQGRVAAASFAASGADIAEPGRRVSLRFERRSRWVPEQAEARPIAAPDDAPVAGPDAARFGAVARIGQAVAQAVAASNGEGEAGAAERQPRRRRARLPLAIRENATLEAPRRGRLEVVPSGVAPAGVAPAGGKPAGAVPSEPDHADAKER